MPRIATKLIMIVALAFGIYGHGIAVGQFIDEEQDTPADAGDEIPGTTDPPASPPPTTPPITPPTPAPGGSDELRTPRFNVRGGSVAARRPGTWVSAGLGKAVARQSVIIKERGGATFGPAAETPTVQKVLLLGFLQSLFDGIGDFLFATLANSTVGNGLPGGGGTSSKPEILTNGRIWEFDKQTYQVIVLFANDVEKASAETASNYTINGLPATKAVLDTTEPTVTVTFTGASFSSTQSRITVALDRIKNTRGDTGVGSDAGPILQNTDDGTRPTVVSVTAKTDKQIEVIFSEVMDKDSCETITNYHDIDRAKAPTDAELGTDGLTVTLTFDDTIVDKKVRLSVNDQLKDVNNKLMFEVEKDVPVVVVAPVITPPVVP